VKLYSNKPHPQNTMAAQTSSRGKGGSKAIGTKRNSPERKNHQGCCVTQNKPEEGLSGPGKEGKYRSRKSRNKGDGDTKAKSNTVTKEKSLRTQQEPTLKVQPFGTATIR